MSSVSVGVIGLFSVLILFLSGIEIAYAMAIVGFPRLLLPGESHRRPEPHRQRFF